jgi:hypothetical protein
MIDFASVSVAVVSLLSPYLPQLLSLGKRAGEKIGEAIIDKGVDAAGGQVKKLWGRISGYFKDDLEVTSAATMVAASPTDALRQQMLGQVLAERLKEHPELAEELIELMGGKERLQQIIVGNEATVRDIRMKMAGAGKQSIEGGDKAVVERVELDMSE